MFKTYKELMDSASFKGILRLHGDKRIAPLKTVNFFYKGRKIELPMLNTVIIPGKATNNFIGGNHLDLLIECDFSFSVKYKTKKSVYDRKLSKIEGEKFYAYALHHGYDYGHHREPTITGLFIHAKTLEAAPETLIESYSQIYADLKKLEDRKAFYTGRGANPNPKFSLEQKIRSLSDPNLYSWG